MPNLFFINILITFSVIFLLIYVSTLHLFPKEWREKVNSNKKSLNPNVENFRQFPKYLKKFKKNDSIAMFCTGGIRCEKANIYLEKKGFKNVYLLKGGIINYLNKIEKMYNEFK